MKKHLCLLAALSAVILPLHAETIYVLTSGNRLLTIDSATPGTVTSTLAITGLESGETLRGVDFRPFSGEMFALGSSHRLYVINIVSGVATGTNTPGTFTAIGTSFGFDFNPVVDRIRVTSDADQNLRLNHNGTLTSTDSTLKYNTTDPNAAANPNVVGSAYTNSFFGAQATTLYDIDSALDIVAIQNPPNAGTLNTVGPLGVNTSDRVGFDISPSTGVAYASLTVGGTAGLYTINLASGAATLLGAIADAATLGSETVVDIAVPAITRLLNLSTRGRVAQGENVLIAGFIVNGFAPQRFVLRAIGPSLGAAGVAGPLADPMLALYNRNGVVVRANDDWRDSPQMSEIQASGLAPENDRESAIFIDLSPGTYTAIVSGKDNGAGVALVEVYQVP